MKLIDIHAHTNFKAFDEDYEPVIRDALAAGVGMINVGTQLPTSKKAVAIAEQFKDESVWAIVGQHPIHTGRFAFDRAAFLQLAKHPRVVAIGECGLDYYRLGQFYADANEDDGVSAEALAEAGPPPVRSIDPDEHKRLQREIFLEQIAIAKTGGKPIMVHCREAYADVAAILKEQGVERFDVHCFTGGWEDAKPLLDLGGSLSFTGIITFPKSEKTQEVVRKMPLDRLMVETDCPYLAPVPHRGQRNLPQYVEFVARKVAELRGLDTEEVFVKTVENAVRFFQL